MVYLFCAFDVHFHFEMCPNASGNCCPFHYIYLPFWNGAFCCPFQREQYTAFVAFGQRSLAILILLLISEQGPSCSSYSPFMPLFQSLRGPLPSPSPSPSPSPLWPPHRANLPFPLAGPCVRLTMAVLPLLLLTTAPHPSFRPVMGIVVAGLPNSGSCRCPSIL